jgi:hypothetical protein
LTCETNNQDQSSWNRFRSFFREALSDEDVIAEGKGFTAMLLGGNASILYLISPERRFPWCR